MKFLMRLLTWWNSQTLGTQIFTWRKGQRVGEDAAGQHLLPDPRRQAPLGDLQRRDRGQPGQPGLARLAAFHLGPAADRVSPLAHKPWEKPHLENLTGTARAYAPAGSHPPCGPARPARLRGLAPGTVP